MGSINKAWGNPTGGKNYAACCMSFPTHQLLVERGGTMQTQRGQAYGSLRGEKGSGGSQISTEKPPIGSHHPEAAHFTPRSCAATGSLPHFPTCWDRGRGIKQNMQSGKLPRDPPLFYMGITMQGLEFAFLFL